MDKSYQPTDFEDRIYAGWESAGYFKADDSSTAPNFVIPIPPPNVTGVLHNGHALGVALQDSLIRWKRMKGFNTLWMPGTDHAGIATQMVVERELAKEKQTRHQLGRKAFVDKIWQWKEKHGEIIFHQMRKLGASPDWERARFTMDPGMSQAVRVAFVKLYSEGLIYKGTRMTSRCTRCETVLSDLEVISKERKSHLWHIRYPSKDGKSSLVVATSRPETLLGDTAVAVHPEDERFTALHGARISVPLTGRDVPLILDEYVDREFGTGALKVTPGHDFNDYELGKKHNLPMMSVIGLNGKLTAQAGKYAGLSVNEARKQVLADLTEQGLLEKEQEITQQIGLCQRCETVVEPLVSDQWFMQMKTLAEKASAAARRGEKIPLSEIDSYTDAFKIVPEMHTNTFDHWMDNIRDWCISRQLWWGHQIPAWYCGKCQHITVAEQDPTECESCHSPAAELRQDEDVLDTWFSSGLWPFATLGWPEKTPAYKTFYPATVLETGSDILFFWVARMLMLGIHLNDGKVPFTRVYLHAMVRDEKGAKMSKTKGNVIDPLDLVRDYGADAFRMTLIAMSGQGRDIRLSLDRIAGYRAFCTKLWNASRYTFMRLGYVKNETPPGGNEPPAGMFPSEPVNFEKITGGQPVEDWLRENHSRLHPINRWMITRVGRTARRIDQALGEYQMSDAAQELYTLLWNDFCDWYIEFSKELLRHPEFTPQTQLCLVYVLRQILFIAHPQIPFITEEIFKNMPKLPGENLKTLMRGPFPEFGKPFQDETAEQMVEVWKNSIDRLRAFRGENSITPKARPSVTYRLNPGANQAAFEAGIPYIVAVAQLESLKLESGALEGKNDTGEVLANAARFFIPLRGLVNFEEELKRLEKQKAKLADDIQFIETKLGKPDFVARAPEELIEEEKGKLLTYREQLAVTNAAIHRLSKALT